jgi:hypothetical protein
VARFGSAPVLDASGILLSTIAAQGASSVGFDGTNYLVVWEDFRSGSEIDLFATRVTPAGEVLDPNGILIGGAGDQRAPAVTFDGTNYLVVWQRSAPDPHIRGVRISPAGTPLGGSFVVSDTAGNQETPSVAFNGTNFLVTWQDLPSPSVFPRIRAARVSPAGTVLDPTPIVVPTTALAAEAPTVAANGTTFLVAWQDLRSTTDYDLWAARISGAGAVLDASGFPVAASPDDEFAPAAAAGGGNTLVAWTRVTGAQLDIRATRISGAGAVLDADPGIAIATDAADQDQPSLAFNGSFLVLWRDRRNGNADIFGNRVTTAGATEDGSGFEVQAGPGEDGRPSVTNGHGGGWGASYDRANRAFFRTITVSSK